MKVIKLIINKTNDRKISLIAGYLKKGKVIAYPTDTVYGLGCRADNKQALLKLKRIKGAANNKALLVLVNGFDMLKKYCLIDKAQEKYLKNIWISAGANLLSPKIKIYRPVTAILDKKNKLPEELTGGLPGLAVRIPQGDFLHKIILKLGVPLVSTSLNLSGDTGPLSKVDDLEKYFKDLPDLVINAGVIKGKSSRLIDVRDMKNIAIIRK